MLLSLNLLQYKEKLSIVKKEGKQYVFDGIRKKHILLTPEEWVRQLLIQYLMLDRNISKNKISVEREIKVNTLQKRFDIVVYSSDIQPFILIECKAPNIVINQTTFNQIAAYNLVLKADFLIVCNGIQTYCCKMNHEKQSFDFVDEIPNLNI